MTSGFTVVFITAFCRWAAVLLPVILVVSRREFQAPQLGHFPLHLEVSAPHSVQKKLVMYYSFDAKKFRASATSV
jgi:hypothetical protein